MTANRVCNLFGIRYPLVQAGMVWCSPWQLAAAVSNAGGLGIITGLTQRTPEDLAKEIARCRDPLRFEDIMDEVVGIYPRVMKEGDVEAGA